MVYLSRQNSTLTMDRPRGLEGPNNGALEQSNMPKLKPLPSPKKERQFSTEEVRKAMREAIWRRRVEEIQNSIGTHRIERVMNDARPYEWCTCEVYETEPETQNSCQFRVRVVDVDVSRGFDLKYIKQTKQFVVGAGEFTGNTLEGAAAYMWGILVRGSYGR
jgi:hypothetical protein